MQAKESLSYDDILLVPQYSTIQSRKEIDIGGELDDEVYLQLPIIASPMDTISEAKMSVALRQKGGLAVIHRYNTIEEQCSLVSEAVLKPGPVAAAVGVSGEYLDRATGLYDAGATILCVDIAHGHHIFMKQTLQDLRHVFGDTVHIMAGNVATLEGFSDLAAWGANSVRVGIGGGSICSTRIQTGHGIPTLDSIIAARVAKHDGRWRDVKIIADGGIKSAGDIVKALACGADFVMVGSLLAGADECPGDIIKTKEGSFKTYRGMASKDAQIEWRGQTSSLEGVSTVVPCRGPVTAIIDDLERGIRSGLSYSGARTIRELQDCAQFIIQSTAGQYESSTHILSR